MNVASLELCKELYELSGWCGTHWSYSEHDLDGNIIVPYCVNQETVTVEAPAYDLGYLLRKLPTYLRHVVGIYSYLKISSVTKSIWAAYYGDDKYYEERETTPEDAACKLAIELFKQGILTREK